MAANFRNEGPPLGRELTGGSNRARQPDLGRLNPIRIAGTPRLGRTNAIALRDVQAGLEGAQQNLRKLLQGMQSVSGRPSEGLPHGKTLFRTRRSSMSIHSPE